MADEQKTLLHFEGDASGVKAAAQEQVEAVGKSKAAVDGLKGAEKELQEQSASASNAVRKAGEAADQAGASFDGAGLNAAAFASVLGQVDPRLGKLVQVGTNLGKILSSAFTPAGLMTGGLAAALGVVATLVQGIQASVEKTKRDLAELEAAKARIARERLEAAGEVGKALAAHGAGSEGAVDRAAAQIRASEGEGFERGVAVKVSAATEAAGMTLSDEERRRLSMGVQLGAVHVAGRTPMEARASIEEALQKISTMGPDLQRSLEAAIMQTMRGANLGQMREAAAGTEGILEDVLRKLDPAIGDSALQEQARQARAFLSGTKPVDAETRARFAGYGPAAFGATQAEAEAADYAAGEQVVARLQATIREQEERILAQQRRVQQIVAQDAEARSEAKAWSDTFKPEEPEAVKTPSRRASVQRQRQSFDPDASNRPTTINYHFSGVNNLGTRDPRLLRGPRQPIQ